MDVSELRKYLSDFPAGATVQVVVKNRPMSFELLYGTSEGVTKQTAESVSFYVDSSNGQEERADDKV